MKRFIALLLTAVMGAGLMAVPVFADENEDPAGVEVTAAEAVAPDSGSVESVPDESGPYDIAGAEVTLGGRPVGEPVNEEDVRGMAGSQTEIAGIEDPALPADDAAEAGELEELPGEESLNGANDPTIFSSSVTASKNVYRIDIVNSGTSGNTDGTIDDVDETKFKPVLTVKKDGKTLKEGTDYVITNVYTYSTNSITVTIEGRNGYDGTKTIKLPAYLAWTCAGSNRYGTGIEIVKQIDYRDGMDFTRIVVVSGVKFPDALAANAYAGIHHNPLILVKPDKVPPVVESFLKENAPEIHEVVLIGGELKGAEKGLKKILPTASFKTIAGKNRYRTADEVTKAFIEEYGYDPNGTDKIDRPVFVATGQVAADALSASSWSYGLKIPVILAKNGTVDAVSKKILSRFSTVILLGSSSAVKDSCVPAGAAKIRLGGKNRWATSRAIADYFSEESYLGGVVYAPGGGSDFVDALAAGQFGVGYGVILVDKNHADVYHVGYAGNYFVGSAGYKVNGGAVFNNVNNSLAKAYLEWWKNNA